MRPDRPRACGCGEMTGVRLFACGPRCPAHTPAALAGRPEPDAARYCAPWRCYCQDPGCLAVKTSPEPVLPTVKDARDIASGKRRARSLAEYRAAQAQVSGGRR